MADVELNSIGNGDGTNYLVRDNTKIPLSGSNQISGDLIPSTDGTVNLGSSGHSFNIIYGSRVVMNDIHGVTDHLGFYSMTADTQNWWRHGAGIDLYSENYTDNAGGFNIFAAKDGTQKVLEGRPNGTLTWAGKNVAMQEDTVPRSGGAVFDGYEIFNTTNNRYIGIGGGTGWGNGAIIIAYGKDRSNRPGYIQLGCTNGINFAEMLLAPNGTWTWDGTACQITSDQRYKQQIAEIDDKLLDAWEDVNLVQFKYNDAVKEKSDNARLHTGYVVQQVDEACKSHGVDISKYGLYCHEEYAEETREVEQADGTKTTEVVRPASEHYSLRYTEALIVECAFLRKKNKDLQEQLNALSERLEKLENR